jgi:hypothetical protein
MPPLARFAALALSLLLAGCAMGPRVVSAGPQTYSVSSDDGLSFSEGTGPAREAVFRAANRFCAKRKLVMVPVSLDVHPGDSDGHLPSVDLVFRALRRGDPEIGRSQAVFRHYDPMVVRESVVNFTPDPADSQPDRPTGRKSTPRP